MENPAIMQPGPQANGTAPATTPLQVVSLDDAVKAIEARIEAANKVSEDARNKAAAEHAKAEIEKHLLANKAGTELQARIGENATKGFTSAFEHKNVADAYKAGYSAVDAAMKDLLATKKIEGEERPSFHIRKRDVYIAAGVTAGALGVGGYLVYKNAHEAGLKQGLSMQIENIYKATK